MNPLAGLMMSNVVTSNILAPVLALLPVTAANLPFAEIDVPVQSETADEGAGLAAAPPADPASDGAPLSFADLARTVREGETVRQVRIEQRVIIRVAPAPVPRPQRRPTVRDLRNSFFDTPGRMSGGIARFEERRMNQCVPVAAIAGVQPESGRLVLFMRDQRIVSASLDKACNVRDFYSGFLVERSVDGMLCGGRDKLLSRSGTNCALGKLRQLVEVDDGP